MPPRQPDARPWRVKMPSHHIAVVHRGAGFTITVTRLGATVAVTLRNEESRRSFIVRSFDDDAAAVKFGIDLSVALDTDLNPVELNVGPLYP